MAKSIEIYIEMVKKLKVVDVDQAEAEKPVEVVEEKPIEVIEEKPLEVIEEKQPEVIEQKPPEVAEVKPEIMKPKAKPVAKLTEKHIEEVTCENCNKKMLMKTYKYSHQKVCKVVADPKTPAPKKQTDTPFQQEPSNTNTVSFDVHDQPFPNGNAYLNTWNELRQQRHMVRQQRVKSLISQAI
jgi:hypothetical protein